MSAVAIVQAVKDLLEANVPDVQVLFGIPQTVSEARVLYVYHDGSTDLTKTQQVVRRTHVIALHLLVLTGGDDQQAELDLLDLHDTISDLFYTNHRLNDTASTSELHQRDGEAGSAGGQYVIYQDGEYRHRWWTLLAAEDKAFSMS